MRLNDDLIATDIAAYLEKHEHKSLLRFITCGSVDDGKSTLIGRLLYDSKMIFEDQLAALETMTKQDLANRWARLTGRPVARVSTKLLRLALAYEIQAKALGGLPRQPRVQRFLLLDHGRRYQLRSLHHLALRFQRQGLKV